MAKFPKYKGKKSRREFLQELAEFSVSMRAIIEAEVDGFSTDPEASTARRRKAQADFAYFSATYFPHYNTKKPSRVHNFLFAKLQEMADDPRGSRLGIAAPRGEAKSTIGALEFVAWCIVTDRKHVIPWIMDTYEQAAVALEAFKAELEVNPRLAMDFPEACGTGRVWRDGEIVTANDAKVKAFGTGKRLRGLKHGPRRPDLAIIDDAENDENVQQAAQRDKLHNWILRAVLKLGPADGTMDVLMIGTMLHYDSALARLQQNPMWEGYTFKALLRFPDRMDLWDAWEEILRNAEGDRRAAAREFYEAHREEMEAGAEVSWPEGRPLYVLMEVRAEDPGAFDAEIQNEPISDEDRTFHTISFWVTENPRWIYYGQCDPSLGKHKRKGDPSALLVGGFDRERGILDVVAADIRRRVPDRIIEDIISLQKTFHCQTWWIESTAFQEFLRTELVKRSAERGVPVPALPWEPHTDKDLRIEGIQPHVVNGLIRFHASQTTLLEQLRNWPQAPHDDGPDCLAGLWENVAGRGIVGPAMSFGTLQSAGSDASLV